GRGAGGCGGSRKCPGRESGSCRRREQLTYGSPDMQGANIADGPLSVRTRESALRHDEIRYGLIERQSPLINTPSSASSRSGKKKVISLSAFSSESEPCTAFLPLDSAKRLRMVPSAASAGSVAPMVVRQASTASAFSSVRATAGPELMNSTSSP